MINKNAERYTELPIRYFKAIGFEFEDRHLWMKFVLVKGLFSMSVIILTQVLYIIFADDNMEEKIACVLFLNYFIVCIGKLIVLLYNRKRIYEVLNSFRPIYPTVQLESEYSLDTYLKKHLLIQNILVLSLHVTCTFFSAYPLMSSLLPWIQGGSIVRRLPLKWWTPFTVPDNWFTYAVIYFYQIYSSYIVAVVILGLDLCLYSCLQQLCMHFDVINRNIIKIEPDDSNGVCESSLKKEISYHQRILLLGEQVNEIFTPSILFSLFSSSIILCFTLIQLLVEISTVAVLKTLLLMTYELKQVIVTCVLADKLMEISSKVSEKIYEHKWYNGSLKYKRLVLIVLLRSQRHVALNVAGISDVSLQTLRQVMSISYQVFTVLRR